MGDGEEKATPAGVRKTCSPSGDRQGRRSKGQVRVRSLVEAGIILRLNSILYNILYKS